MYEADGEAALFYVLLAALFYVLLDKYINKIILIRRCIKKNICKSA